MLVQELERVVELLHLQLKKIIGWVKVRQLAFDIEIDEESLAGGLSYVNPNYDFLEILELLNI